MLCSLYELMSKAQHSAGKLSGITCGWKMCSRALDRSGKGRMSVSKVLKLCSDETTHLSNVILDAVALK